MHYRNWAGETTQEKNARLAKWGRRKGGARRAGWEGEYAMSPKMERNWKEKRGAEISRKLRKKVLAEWGRRVG